MSGALHVLDGRQSRLTHCETVAWQRRNDGRRVFGIHVKGSKVSLVDTNDARAGVNGALSLVRVMHFDQGVDPTPVTELQE